MPKLGEALKSSLTKSLHDEEFVARHRTKPTAFTRERKLPFHRLCLMLIWNLRAALHLDLERFFDQLPGNIVAPHPSAFSKARTFLSASAFVELNENVIDVAGNAGLRDNRWHGLRLLAVDGSTCRLPKGSQEIVDHFGGQLSRHDTFLPMARMSYLFEVRTGLIIAGQISPLAEGEGPQAYELVKGRVWEEDCVLYDRGYYNQRIFAWSFAQSSNFVIRVPVGKINIAQDFVDSGETETEFIQTIDDAVIEEFKGYGLEIPKTCRLRFVRVLLNTGEVEVLVTNLIDREKYPASEFQGIYHERWNVEEGIKTTKCKIEVENWTGKSVDSIYQDFHARIVCQNIAVSLALASQPTLDRGTTECEHTYKINVKRAIGLVRDQFIKMMTGTSRVFRKVFMQLILRLPKSASIVRPGRSFPRRKPRRIPPAQPYKPIA